jgi:hypothetical protein
MRQKVFAINITSKEDMAVLESTVGSLLGGEQNKCALVRSQEFIKLRLSALYGRGERAMSVYGGDLQIKLDADRTVTVYHLSFGVDQDETLLGKRAECEPDTDF